MSSPHHCARATFPPWAATCKERAKAMSPQLVPKGHSAVAGNVYFVQIMNCSEAVQRDSALGRGCFLISVAKKRKRTAIRRRQVRRPVGDGRGEGGKGTSGI
eukprot:SAG31_NODE_8368_length_1464_cov_2.544322_2_plen_101_part_01